MLEPIVMLKGTFLVPALLAEEAEGGWIAGIVIAVVIVIAPL